MDELINKTIGPINIGIEINNCKFKFFAEKFQGQGNEEFSGVVDILIRVSEKTDRFQPEYFSSSIELSGAGYFKKTRYFDYDVTNLFGQGKTVINVYPKKKFNLKNKLKIFLKELAGDNLNSCIVNDFFSYRVFWGIFAIALLKKDCAFIHCGCLDADNQGLIFAGTGGCGKTSTSFSLLERQGVKYLAEDFGIIDKNGIAYFNPKHMAIYNSDIKYKQKDLVNYKKNTMSKYTKLVWKLYEFLGKNPKIRVAPEVILEESRIKEKTNLKKVFFLARKSGEKIETKDISLEDFVERAQLASFRELTPMNEILSHHRAIIGKDTQFMTFSEVEKKYKEVYKCCFEHVERKLCFLPKKVNPKDTLNVLGLGN